MRKPHKLIKTYRLISFVVQPIIDAHQTGGRGAASATGLMHTAIIRNGNITMSKRYQQFINNEWVDAQSGVITTVAGRGAAGFGPV